MKVKFSSSEANVLNVHHCGVHLQLILLQQFVQGSYSSVNLEGKTFKKKVIFLT